MRQRNIEKHFFFDKSEAQSLEWKANKAGLTEAALVRFLVSGYEPREKPDDRFYATMNQLYAISDKMNQITRRANVLHMIDAPYYRQQAEQLQKFELDVYEHFILADKAIENHENMKGVV